MGASVIIVFISTVFRKIMYNYFIKILFLKTVFFLEFKKSSVFGFNVEVLGATSGALGQMFRPGDVMLLGQGRSDDPPEPKSAV